MLYIIVNNSLLEKFNYYYKYNLNIKLYILLIKLPLKTYLRLTIRK